MPATKNVSQAVLYGALILLVSFTHIANATAQACVEPPTGLVSWWPGEGNADDIAGPHDGTLQNGVAFAPGIVGQAFSFNGNDQYVELPSSHLLYNPAGGFTWSAWVRPAAVAEMVIMGAADDVGCADLDLRIGGLAELGVPPNTVVARVDPVESAGCVSRTFFSAPLPRGIEPGTVYHLALTVDYPNGLARLYVNGQATSETALAGTPIARDMKVTIGAFRDGLLRNGSPVEFPFNGLIDEIVVFNRPLTGQEVHAIFGSGAAGMCRLIPLADFAAQAELGFGPRTRDDSFNVAGTFSLGANSDGIFPNTENVSLQVGAFTTTIPAGSFTQHGSGRFEFRGTINHVALWVAIEPSGGNDFRFMASAAHVDLTGTLIPLTVKLTIGKDGGSANLARGQAVFKKTPGRHRR